MEFGLIQKKSVTHMSFEIIKDGKFLCEIYVIHRPDDKDNKQFSVQVYHYHPGPENGWPYFRGPEMNKCIDDCVEHFVSFYEETIIDEATRNIGKAKA